MVALAGNPRASAVGPPEPVDRGLAGPSSSNPPAPALIVRYKASANLGDIKRLERELGIETRREHPRSGLHVLELPDGAAAGEALSKVLASGLAIEAGVDLTVTAFDVPNDPAYPRQWHLHDTDGGLRAEAAWDSATNRGDGVVVAVIDTGVAFESHSRSGLFGTMTFSAAPDLAGVPIVAPWNFIHDDAHPNDDQGHGTHVAGTVLQATDNAAGMAGVAPDASLMPIKILDFSGQGQASDLIESLYYAVDNGADVINLSLGFSNTGSPNASGEVCTEIVGLAAALDYADSHGVTVVAATGNDGAATVSCPAAYPTVIAVGATRFDAAVTYYSNRGEAIDVSAPGGDPNVDQNGDSYADGVLQQTFCFDAFTMLFSGDYTAFCDVYYSGTSMATPHVAGVAALLLGENSALTPAQVRFYLESTARDGGAAGWDVGSGHGIVDAASAVAALMGGEPPVFTPTPTPSVSPTSTPTATPTATPTPVPSAPTNLVASASGPDGIALTWTDNANDEQYYRIERSTDGAAFAQVGILLANSTSWTNTGLSPSTTYHYRVRASAGSAYSAYSNVATATTADPPAAPSNLVAIALGPDSVGLSWTDNAGGEQYYRVERSTDGVSYSQVAILLANTTSWTNSYLSPSTTYFYRVRASAGTVYSGYSNVSSATTGAPPAAPANLVATVLGADSIRLNWSDLASDEQYYRVERSIDGGNFTQVAVVLANTTTWTNTGLAPATTYHYRVRASTGSVYSGYSNTVAATTAAPPAAPTNLSATTPTPDSIRLTWTDNASGEQYYRIERSADGVTFSQVAILLANTTSWTNSYLPPSTTYFYRVRASAGTVYSSYSNVASATTAGPPAAPSNLVATAGTSRSIRLTWSDNSSTEQYFRIERSTDGVAFTQVALVTANTNTWTNWFLTPNQTYYYRVRASVGSAYSPYSNTASAAVIP